MIDHRRAAILAATAIDFRLAPAETDELAGHLATCPACRHTAEGLRADAAALTRLPYRDAPEQVRVAVARASAGAVVRRQNPYLLVAAALLLLAALIAGTIAVGALLRMLERTARPEPSLPPGIETPGPAPTGSPGPTASPTRVPVLGLDWAPPATGGALRDETGSTVMADVIAAGPGFIAVGSDSHGAAIWTSPDGLAWTRLPGSADRDGATMGGIVAFRGGFVAVGSHVALGRGIVWTSGDGVSWTAVPHQAALEDAALETIFPAGERLFATGLTCVPPCMDPGSMVWTSTDGLAWTPIPDAPALTGDGIVSMRSVVAGRPGFVAVGADGDIRFGGGVNRALVWTSTDGLAWSRVPDAPAFDRAGMSEVIVGGPGLVAVGWTVEEEGPGRPVGWTSVDGTAWIRVDLAGQPGSQVNSVVAGGPGLVAVGSTPVEPGAERQVATVWTSPPVPTAPTPTPTPSPAALAGRWERRKEPPTYDGSAPAAAGADGRIYAFQHPDGTPGAQAYDPATDAWETLAPVEWPIGQAAVTGLDGAIYLVGGEEPNGTYLGLVKVYDPGVDAWTIRTSMPIGRIRFVAALGRDGRIYVFGGLEADRPERTVLAYDPASDAWETLGEAPIVIDYSEAAAVTGPDGRIYLVTRERAWAYDPASDAWTPRAATPTARREFAAALGPDGLIYVFGGALSEQAGWPLVTAMVERYDPVTDTWSTATPMPEARAFFPAVTGPDGRIYLLGGYTVGADGQPVSRNLPVDVFIVE